MPSNYTINVSRNRVFYFRAIDEFASLETITATVKDFRTRFPESEGFEITLTRWECFGKTVEV